MEKGIVESLDFFGQGVIKQDGKIYFVKNALPQETVGFSIGKNSKRFGNGIAREIIETSDDRIDAPCPYYGVCGGCQFQHCSYDLELEAKENHVKNVLQRIGGMAEIPFIPMDKGGEIYGYRNKVTWQMRGGQTGFFKEKSKDFLPIEKCLLLSESLNEATKYLNSLKIKTLTSASMRCNEKGEVALWVEGGMTQDAVEKLMVACPTIVSVKTEKRIYGAEAFYLNLGKFQFRVSPRSFFQVNTAAAKSMMSYTKSLLGNERRKILLDVYCGVGTIGIYLGKLFSKVYGIESFTEATIFAKENAEHNGVKAELLTAKAETGLTDYLKKIPKADCVVIDPPRNGLDQTVTETLRDYEAAILIYISCDPATMSRDLKILTETYTPVSIKPFNLFPRTAHVETVVLLSHKKPDSHIHVKVEFGEGEGKVPLDKIAERAEAYKPKERVTYKMIKEYIEATYGFKVHTAYIAEVKRDLGLPMYDAPNAVEELKQPRKHPTAEKVEAIKDALKHFEVI